VRIRRIENKMGLHASPTCEIQYHNTPAELVGKRRYGLMRYAMSLMNGARLAVGAQAVGIAEAAYREAYRYASQRRQFGGPIRRLAAVKRMLLAMRGEIEAARAVIAETGRWVDLLKAYEQLMAENPTPDPLVRQKQKMAANLAETLTPLTKYYATEMGNRVCYLAMQIHGGVGYMREFNVERHFRDIRVTNIYEGTSQLQVVAAQGKLLGHALDGLLDQWSGMEVDDDLLPQHASLLQATALFKQATDALKGQSREMVDYYASDLADMAVYISGGWLLLKDAQAQGRKGDLLRVYLAQHLPEVKSKGEALLQADPAGVAAREEVL
jgi:alkylation response protein AidB-like acyl-CoA dehydrogenase